MPGVKKVNIIGEQSERIFVSFSHDRLATLGISPQDIFSALNSQNVLTPAGSIDTSGPQAFIRLALGYERRFADFLQFVEGTIKTNKENPRNTRCGPGQNAASLGRGNG